ncbi:MAG TPA: dephospho-CoA kinase [Nitrospirota bacterium]|nr:dephospho-CoA kinase [Nitrospirota bacterium]
MLIVGLTGGIASGKSIVAKVFQGLGAHIIDADKIVHALLEPGQQAWEEVIEYFGPEILFTDKTIDRRKLGEIVFNDAEKRTWLNRCLHPKVFEAYTASVRNLCTRAPDALVVFDAALLIETGYHKKMDRLVVVYADEEQQVERLTSRDRFSREQALTRVRSQMPLSEKRKHADYVIENTGTREETERQAREVFQKLKREAEGAYC